MCSIGTLAFRAVVKNISLGPDVRCTTPIFNKLASGLHGSYLQLIENKTMNMCNIFQQSLENRECLFQLCMEFQVLEKIVSLREKAYYCSLTVYC